MAKFTDYIPSRTLSEAGKSFLDDFIWHLFDQTKDEELVSESLTAEAKLTNFIEVSNVDARVKAGDYVFVSNKSGGSYLFNVVAAVNGIISNVRIPDSTPEAIEIRRVKSIEGRTVELDMPLAGSYPPKSTVMFKINGQQRVTLLFEDISLPSEASMLGAVPEAKYYLDTYKVSYDATGDTYEFPLFDKSLFPLLPSIRGISISYIDPTYYTWVSLTKGVDFFIEDPVPYVLNDYVVDGYIESPNFKFIMTRSSSVNKPATVAGTPTYRALRIEYVPLVPSDIIINDALLNTFNEAGTYFRGNDNFGFNDDGIFETGMPEISINLMSSSEEPLHGVELDHGTNPIFEDNYAYLTSVEGISDVIPVHKNDIIKSSKDIHSSKGSLGLVKAFARLSKYSVDIEEDYAINLAPALKVWENFSPTQTLMPSFELVRILHKFLDNTSPLLKNVVSGYGNSGGLSRETYSGDFVLSFIVRNTQASQVGFTTAFTDFTVAGLDVAVQMNADLSIDLYKGGVVDTLAAGTYVAGDTVSIAKAGPVYAVAVNGIVIGNILGAQEESYVIGTLDSGVAELSNFFVVQTGLSEEVYWQSTTGVDRGQSILQRYLVTVIPTSLITVAATIIDDGYAIPPHGSYGYGAIVEYNPTQLVWSDDNLKLVYQYMTDFISIFNGLIHDTIHDILNINGTYRNHEIMILSSFSVVATTEANSVFQTSAKQRITAILDEVRPFTRHLNETTFIENVV